VFSRHGDEASLRHLIGAVLVTRPRAAHAKAHPATTAATTTPSSCHGGTVPGQCEEMALLPAERGWQLDLVQVAEKSSEMAGGQESQGRSFTGRTALACWHCS